MVTLLTKEFYKAFTQIKAFSRSGKEPSGSYWGKICLKPTDHENVVLEASTGNVFASIRIPMKNALDARGVLLPRSIKNMTRVSGRFLLGEDEAHSEALEWAEGAWPNFSAALHEGYFGKEVQEVQFDSNDFVQALKDLPKPRKATTLAWTPAGVEDSPSGTLLASLVAKPFNLNAIHTKAAARMFGKGVKLTMHSSSFFNPLIIQSVTRVVALMGCRDPRP